MAKYNILVADNDPDFRESLVKDVLELEGYRVYQAGNPEEARQILKKELIHLAILDIRLENDDDPDDKSGEELSKEIDPVVARIVLTGYLPEWILPGKVPGKVWIPFTDPSVEWYMLQKSDGPEVVLEAVKNILQEEYEIIPKRRIAVMTSGGDSPGMNAAIRSIVRIAMDNDLEVIGVQEGYKGLANNLMHKLTWNEVSDILVQGGTILGTARFSRFKEDAETRKKAVSNLINKHVSGLIVIGGDGSMKGAQALSDEAKKQHKDLQVITIPGTIDNDLWGTDMSLGAASAVNAMVEEMRNMLRPALALRRIFICEVMGRYCGYPAVGAALGIGADAVIIPEQVIQIRPGTTNTEPLKNRVMAVETEDKFRDYLKKITNTLKKAFSMGKGYGFVIMAEGIRLLTENHPLDIEYIRKFMEDNIENWPISDKPGVRAHVVGYPVRGVPPSRYDLWLGAKLGAASVQCLLEGKTNVMVGFAEGCNYDTAGKLVREPGVIETPFKEVLEKSNRPPHEICADRPSWQELLEMHEALACPPALREQLRTSGNRFV